MQRIPSTAAPPAPVVPADLVAQLAHLLTQTRPEYVVPAPKRTRDENGNVVSDPEGDERAKKRARLDAFELLYRGSRVQLRLNLGGLAPARK
jgi:hypothetical protein